MYEVTIKKIEDDEITFETTLEYEDAHIVMERGVIRKYIPRSGETEFRPNGHQRATIQLWSGCSDFENFVADEEEVSDE